MNWQKISTENPFHKTISVFSDNLDAPIARWSSVPLQWAHNGDVIKPSVVAYHHSGIDRVEFICDGGEFEEGAHKIVVDKPIVNISNNQDEYICSINIDGLWSEGIHTLRAIVYSKSGKKRVLQGNWLPAGKLGDSDNKYPLNGEVDFTFIVNNGSYNGKTIWVDSENGLDSNLGTFSSPLKNLWSAIEKIHENSILGEIKEDKIFCKKGYYRLNPLEQKDWLNNSLPSSIKLGSGRIGWLTIESDPSCSRKDVIITNSRGRFSQTFDQSLAFPNIIYSRFLCLKNLSLEHNLTGEENYIGNSDDIIISDNSLLPCQRGLWIDECEISCRKDISLASIINNNQSKDSEIYKVYQSIASDVCGFATKCIVNRLYEGFKNFNLVSDTGFGSLANFAFLNCSTILSCTINNVGGINNSSVIKYSDNDFYDNKNILVIKNKIENVSSSSVCICPEKNSSFQKHIVSDIAIIGNYFTSIGSPNNFYIYNKVKNIFIYQNTIKDIIYFRDLPNGIWSGEIDINNFHIDNNIITSIEVQSDLGSTEINAFGANKLIKKLFAQNSSISNNVFLKQSTSVDLLFNYISKSYDNLKVDFNFHPVVKDYQNGNLSLDCISRNNLENPAKNQVLKSKLYSDIIGNIYRDVFNYGARQDCSLENYPNIDIEISSKKSKNNKISGFPINSEGTIDWYQSSNFAFQYQFTALDIMLWYSLYIYKIPGAFSDSNNPEGYYPCAVCTLKDLGCSNLNDDGDSFFKRYQLSPPVGWSCGNGNSTTLQEVRTDFNNYFNIDSIIKSQAIYRPDWILVHLRSGSEPLWWPTSVEGLTQWPLLSNDGSNSISIGLNFNALEKYVSASNKYKQRLLAYFFPFAWVELESYLYSFSLDIYGNYIIENRNGQNVYYRSICSSSFQDLLSSIHIELASLGMDKSTGYGIRGVVWDSTPITYKLDFSDDAKIASGIDTSVDFPWPITYGPLYDYLYNNSNGGYGVKNANIATILSQPVNNEVGFTKAVKEKLEQYMYSLRSIEEKVVKKLKDDLVASGYDDFAIIPSSVSPQHVYELPLNSENTILHSSGNRIEIGVENYKYRRQKENNIYKYGNNSLPDIWLGQYLEFLIQQSKTGKRLSAWQVGQWIITNWLDSTSIDLSIQNCLQNFDSSNNNPEFRTKVLPREIAVRGWLENQAMFALASHATIEFTYGLSNWFDYDNPREVTEFENDNPNQSYPHFPYMRRIGSILGSIKESNVYLKNRSSVNWCLIMHSPSSSWKGGTYDVNVSSDYFKYFWPMIGAIQTCVEKGIPHTVVNDESFSSSLFSDSAILIVPFSRSKLPGNVVQEISSFNGFVIWMEDEFIKGTLEDEFHNTSLINGVTKAEIARNKLSSLIDSFNIEPVISASINHPNGLIENPVSIIGYETGKDSYDNDSVNITIAADVSWHDSRKSYLSTIDWNNGPIFSTEYCGRQNLLLSSPGSNVRIEQVDGLRRILDNCSNCETRDCFYIDYSGSNPIPDYYIPSFGKLVYYAGYPPTWDSLRSGKITFSSHQKPYRYRQLVINKDTGKFDPIDGFVIEENIDLLPFEMGSIVHVQLANRDELPKDIGLYIHEDYFLCKNEKDLESLFLELSNRSFSGLFVKVQMNCNGSTKEEDILASIIFRQIYNNIKEYPENYSWIYNHGSGMCVPSDYLPIGFIVSYKDEAPNKYVSISGLVVQNKGVCDIAVKIPALKEMAKNFINGDCNCNSKPNKLFSSRGSLNVPLIESSIDPSDGSSWASIIESEIENIGSISDGLILFIKPDDIDYFTVRNDGLPDYSGILDYLTDIDEAISSYSSGVYGIEDYFYGLVLDFDNFNINNNHPHPKYCAYPYLIKSISEQEINNVKTDIAKINGIYISVIKEIRFYFPELKVSIRGLGKFGDGSTLQVDEKNSDDYSLGDARAELRINLDKRISECYGPLLEVCDFVYIENQVSGLDSLYNTSSEMVSNAVILALRNHFLHRGSSCPDFYLEINGTFSNDYSVNQKTFCKINEQDLLNKYVKPYFNYGINGFVYYAGQEKIAKNVYGSCSGNVEFNTERDRLVLCWGIEAVSCYSSSDGIQTLNDSIIDDIESIHQLMQSVESSSSSSSSSSIKIFSPINSRPPVGPVQPGWWQNANVHFHCFHPYSSIKQIYEANMEVDAEPIVEPFVLRAYEQEATNCGPRPYYTSDPNGHSPDYIFQYREEYNYLRSNQSEFKKRFEASLAKWFDPEGKVLTAYRYRPDVLMIDLHTSDEPFIYQSSVSQAKSSLMIDPDLGLIDYDMIKPFVRKTHALNMKCVAYFSPAFSFLDEFEFPPSLTANGKKIRFENNKNNNSCSIQRTIFNTNFKNFIKNCMVEIVSSEEEGGLGCDGVYWDMSLLKEELDFSRDAIDIFAKHLGYDSIDDEAFVEWSNINFPFPKISEWQVIEGESYVGGGIRPSYKNTYPDNAFEGLGFYDLINNTLEFSRGQISVLKQFASVLREKYQEILKELSDAVSLASNEKAIFIPGDIPSWPDQSNSMIIPEMSRYTHGIKSEFYIESRGYSDLRKSYELTNAALQDEEIYCDIQRPSMFLSMTLNQKLNFASGNKPSVQWNPFRMWTGVLPQGISEIRNRVDVFNSDNFYLYTNGYPIPFDRGLVREDGIHGYLRAVYQIIIKNGNIFDLTLWNGNDWILDKDEFINNPQLLNNDGYYSTMRELSLSNNSAFWRKALYHARKIKEEISNNGLLFTMRQPYSWAAIYVPSYGKIGISDPVIAGENYVIGENNLINKTVSNNELDQSWGAFWWPILGAIQAFEDRFIPYTLMLDNQLKNKEFDGIKTIIIPHREWISYDDEVKLSEFEQVGGNIIYMDDIFVVSSSSSSSSSLGSSSSSISLDPLTNDVEFIMTRFTIDVQSLYRDNKYTGALNYFHADWGSIVDSTDSTIVSLLSSMTNSFDPRNTLLSHPNYKFTRVFNYDDIPAEYRTTAGSCPNGTLCCPNVDDCICLRQRDNQALSISDTSTTSYIMNWGSTIALAYRAIKSRIDRSLPIGSLSADEKNELLQQALDRCMLILESANDHTTLPDGQGIYKFQRPGWTIDSCADNPDLDDGSWLATAWGINGVIMMLDILGSAISEDLQNRLKDQLRYEIFDLIRNWKDRVAWYTRGDFCGCGCSNGCGRPNTNQWIEPACSLINACIFLEDSELLPAYNLGVCLLAQSLKSQFQNGEFSEGWSYAQQTMPQISFTLERMKETGDNRLSTFGVSSGFVNNFWKWNLDCILPGNYVLNMSDCRGQQLPVWAINNPLPSISLSAYASENYEEAFENIKYLFPNSLSNINGILYYIRSQSYTSNITIPNYSHYPESNLVVWRRGRVRPVDANASIGQTYFGLWVKGGSLYETHKHRDEGQFSIYCGKRIVILESGMDYSFPNASTIIANEKGHNIMQIGAVSPRGTPVNCPLSVNSLNDTSGNVSINLKNSYTSVSSYIRNFSWSQAGAYNTTLAVNILDTILFNTFVPTGSEMFRYHTGHPTSYGNLNISGSNKNWTISWDYTTLSIVSSVDILVQQFSAPDFTQYPPSGQSSINNPRYHQVISIKCANSLPSSSQLIMNVSIDCQWSSNGG